MTESNDEQIAIGHETFGNQMSQRRSQSLDMPRGNPISDREIYQKQQPQQESQNFKKILAAIMIITILVAIAPNTFIFDFDNFIVSVQKNKDETRGNMLDRRENLIFYCEVGDFQNWKWEEVTHIAGDTKVVLLPYQGVTLIQNVSEPPPQKHYQELATYIQSTKHSVIYVDSAPVYDLLLIGVASSIQTSILLSPHYSQILLAQINFGFNGIRGKLYKSTDDSYESLLKKTSLWIYNDNVSNLPVGKQAIIISGNKQTKIDGDVLTLSVQYGCDKVIFKNGKSEGVFLLNKSK